MKPCWKREKRRVLQMTRSVPFVSTMATKYAVWNVNSRRFRCEYVCGKKRPGYVQYRTNALYCTILYCVGL